MKNFCFREDYLFLNRDQMLEDSDHWNFTCKEDKEELHCLAELDSIHHFPSFQNIGFDDMIQYKFGNENASKDLHSEFEEPEQNINGHLFINLDKRNLANKKHSIFEGDEKGKAENINSKTKYIDKNRSENDTKEANIHKLNIDELVAQIDSQIQTPTTKLLISSNPVSKDITEEIKEDLTQGHDSSYTSLNENTRLFRRWGKEKDKKAFDMLKNLCQNNGLSVDQFLSADVAEVIDEFKRIFINKLYSNIIQSIAEQYSWMRKPIYLFHRLKKIYSSDNTFSFREIKLLKRLILKSNSDSDDIEGIMYHFPGKSESIIRNAARNIKQRCNLFKQSFF